MRCIPAEGTLFKKLCTIVQNYIYFFVLQDKIMTDLEGTKVKFRGRNKTSKLDTDRDEVS